MQDGHVGARFQKAAVRDYDLALKTAAFSLRALEPLGWMHCCQHATGRLETVPGEDWPLSPCATESS